ncbi:MAG: carotenoid biosynthesis protein [bacterium]|nr:carotenoid biosynthesis protein [bacterium]
MNKQLEKKIIITGFIISFTAILMNLAWDYINPPGVASPLAYNMIIGLVMTGFVYIHSKRYFGFFKANVLFITTALVSWGMEHIGVSTGSIYGTYHYGSIHGLKLFNTVPVLIPLSWFLFLYPAVIISNEILSREKSLVSFLKKGGGAVTIVIFAAVDSIIMTALDLLIDPIWTSRGSWFWTGLDTLRPESVLYKIPVQNYFGWLITTFIIFLIFRTVFFLKKNAFEEKDMLYHLPVYNYIAIFAVGTIEAWILLKSPGVILVSIMTLGFISLVSLYKIFQFYTGDDS